MTLYIKAALVAVLAAILFCCGWQVESWRSAKRYEALELEYAKRAADESAQVRTTLQAQILDLQDKIANNGKVMEQLNHENAQVVADRDANLALARRLLASGQTRPPGSCSLSQASSGQPVARAGRTDAHVDSAQLLADAGDECERNANRLDALVSEVKPQL